MLSLNALFWMFSLIFAVIGSMRGWAKELLVTFACILAIFIINVFETYVPFVSKTLQESPTLLFYFRITILTGMVFFGYQTPNLQRLASNNRFARERFQDYLLGFILGGLNAYLFVGTFWWYLADAGYPWAFIIPPDATTQIGAASLDLLKRMPPTWLKPPVIFFAVALAFAFVLIVFL